MATYFKRWLKICLINLLIVASIGVLLRYKIAFSLPFIDQKHMLHGHSHFAFAGWITQALMVLLVAYLAKQKVEAVRKKYDWLLYANLFTAFGMLIAFPIEGYGPTSILFSSLSVMVSYGFTFFYWRDLSKLKMNSIAHAWFKAAVLFNALSSLGVFALAIMMTNQITEQRWYLAAEYFYLHFQYNGWFFFACMGLFSLKLQVHTSPKALKHIFYLFTAAVVPAYFLSVLWLHIPLWVYVVVVVAAFAQTGGWVLMGTEILKQRSNFKASIPKLASWLFFLSAIALSIKLLLQLGSTIPFLSDLSFGFRPIVIGYLHLVLLGVITIFILGYIVSSNSFVINKSTCIGLSIFITGVIVNEILLMTQGVAALQLMSIPFINELLMLAALIMFTGLMMLLLGLRYTNEETIA